MKKRQSFLQFDFPDFIALCIFVACFLLIAMGKNSAVHYVLASVVGHYFGRKNSRK